MPGSTSAAECALVVDDDRAVATVLGAFLERLGLDVTVVHGRDEAERLLADGGWALFVTDLQLGEGNRAEGLDLLGAARRLCPDARTILVSGSAGPEIDRIARRRGADLFIAKPVSYATLAHGVAALLGGDPPATLGRST
jgi:CheY-like chemotaxis protein